MRVQRGLIVAAAAFASFACGTKSDGASSGSDGGTDGATPERAWTTCFVGTKLRASGWGCEAILPEGPCTGATREVLGKTECVPVGDCSAPFPPDNATHFVSPTGPTDATHFTTLRAAIAAARASSVVAVDEGDYVGSIVVDKDVTIVGRCAAKVKLSAQLNEPAIRVNEAKAIVRGVSIVRTVVGMSVARAGWLVVEDAVLDDNSLAGISLSDGEGTLDAARIVVRGTRPSNSGDRGAGLNLQGTSKATLVDATFAGNGGQNVRVSTSSTATLDRVVLRDGKPTPAADYGRGLQVQEGAKVVLKNAAVVDNYEIGIVAGDRTTLDLENVVVARSKLAKSGSFGRALNAFGGAIVRATALHVHDNHDASIMLAEASTSLVLRGSTVVDTQFDRDGYVGRGITVQEGALLDARDTAIVGSREVGLAVFGAGTRATVSRSLLALTTPNAGGFFGHGVMVTLGGVVLVADSEISSNAGIGLAVGEGAARIAGSRIRANQVGIYAQDGTTVREAEVTALPAIPSDREVLVSSDTLFEGNASKVTAGTLPLPEPSRIAGN